MRILHLIPLCLLPLLAHSQELTRYQIHQDLTALRKAIKQHHPAVERYNPRFERESQELLKQLPDTMSLRREYKYISRMCALSRLGQLRIGHEQDAMQQGLSTGRQPYLPLRVRIVQGQVVVWQDLSAEQQIPRGGRILSINGYPIAKIVNTMAVYLPADGEITASAYRKIEKDFARLYALYIQQPSHYVIEYLDLQGRRRQADLWGIPHNQQLAYQKHRYRQEAQQAATPGDFYQLEFYPKYIYLRLRSFDRALIDELGLKAKRFYKELFTKIDEQRRPALLIDLRGNGGGKSEFADEMIPYILRGLPPHEVYKTVTTTDGKRKAHKLPKRKKQSYSGRVYVLIDGGTQASAAALARYLYEYNLARIVGEEAGTCYEGYTSGVHKRVTLPHSGIEIGFPGTFTRFPESALQVTSNRGLMPDIPCAPTLRDLVYGEDSMLATAVQAVKERR